MKALAVFMLLLLLVAVCAWKYSGRRELLMYSYQDGELVLENGSRWKVYEEDRYRIRKWDPGDKVKLIDSRGFYTYEWLGLNVDKLDAVHLHCVEDAF